jgi:hypothetical protein
MDNLENTIRQLVQEAMKGLTLTPGTNDPGATMGVFTDMNAL